MSDIREKLIREKVDLINAIDYAMRDFDDYLDECNETCTPPIDKLEDFIADGVISAGYRKQEREHGKWRFKKEEESGKVTCYCTACGRHSGIAYENQFMPYCPNCGAKIDGPWTPSNRVFTDADSGKWIPVSERLPEKEEYTAKSKDGIEYYARLLLAYKTDIVDYKIGYYDGCKWLSEMPMRIIKDVIAWKQFEPLPEPPKGE